MKVKAGLKEKQEDIKLFGVNATILLAVYSTMMNFQITSDHVYAAVIDEFSQFPNMINQLAAGRYTGYFIAWILKVFQLVGVDKVHHQFVLQIAGILVYAIAASILYKIYAEKMQLEKYSIFLNALILIAFVNPFIVETYVYICLDWAIGILLAVLGAKYLLKQRYGLGFLFSFLAVSTYQTNILMVLIYCIGAIYIEYRHSFKELFTRIMKCGAITVLAAFINILIPKICLSLGIIDGIVKQTGAGDEWNLRIVWIAQIIYLSIYKGYGMLPEGFLFWMILLISLIAILYFARKKEKKTGLQILYWILLTGILFGMLYAPCFVSSTIGYPQRTMLSLFMSFSVLLICFYSLIKNERLLKYHIGIYLIAGIMLYQTESGIQDCYTSNALDFYEAQCVQETIEAYEQETGNEITQIAVHRASNIHYSYAQLHYENVYALYSHRLFYDAWSDVNLLNYLFDEDYERIDMDYPYGDKRQFYDEICAKYFDGKSWDRLNTEEQIVFDGNVMYWVIY